MRDLRLGAYMLRWGALVGGGLLTGFLPVGPEWGPSVWWAVGVTGLADVVVYVTVARGLVIEPSRFMSWWGLSVLGKLVWFALVSVLLVMSGLVEKKVYLLALGTAFPVLTCHQVISLVRRADEGKARRRVEDALKARRAVDVAPSGDE
jgi:phosphatidylserine synthase